MNTLAVCTVVRDEESGILEWIAFHLAAGADRLIIMDDQSQDSTREIIAEFSARTGLIDLIGNEHNLNQTEAYAFMIDMCRDKYKWAAFIDADEFLFNPAGGGLKELLADYQTFGGIGVFWMLYGSSGHKNTPSGLCIESFLHRAPADHTTNRHVKTIVNLTFVIEPLSSHLFRTTNPIVDENFVAIDPSPPYGFFPNRKPSHSDSASIIITLKVLLNIKKKRPDHIGGFRERFETPDKILQMFARHDTNCIYDPAALVYEAKTKCLMASAARQ